MAGDGIQRRKEMLIEAVERYWSDYGYAPTREELVELTGLSRRTVQKHVAALLKDGALAEEPGKSRTLRVWF